MNGWDIDMANVEVLGVDRYSLSSGCPRGEWREILTRITSCTDYFAPTKIIKYGPGKVLLGTDDRHFYDFSDISRLSGLYPTAIMYASGETDDCSVWLRVCGGRSKRAKEMPEVQRKLIEQMITKAAKTDYIIVEHRRTYLGGNFDICKFKLTDKGTVKLIGNSDCTEACSEVANWTNIKKISCGQLHIVGLRNDGTLVAFGDNLSKQIDVSEIENAVDISCSRFHTAILLEDGSLVLKGFLGQIGGSTRKLNKIEKELVDVEFPFTSYSWNNTCDLSDYISANAAWEHVKIGDVLNVRPIPDYYNNAGWLYTANDELVGRLHIHTLTNNQPHIEAIAPYITVRVSGVKPLSALCPTTGETPNQYAKYKTIVEYHEEVEDPLPDEKDCNDELPGNYFQTPVSEWPKLKKIKSVYDALIGLGVDDKVYICGYCPRTRSQLEKLIKE